LRELLRRQGRLGAYQPIGATPGAEGHRRGQGRRQGQGQAAGLRRPRQDPTVDEGGRSGDRRGPRSHAESRSRPGQGRAGGAASGSRRRRVIPALVISQHTLHVMAGPLSRPSTSLTCTNYGSGGSILMSLGYVKWTSDLGLSSWFSSATKSCAGSALRQ